MMSRAAALRALNRYQIVRSRDQNFELINEFEVRPRGWRVPIAKVQMAPGAFWTDLHDFFAAVELLTDRAAPPPRGAKRLRKRPFGKRGAR